MVLVLIDIRLAMAARIEWTLENEQKPKASINYKPVTGQVHSDIDCSDCLVKQIVLKKSQLRCVAEEPIQRLHRLFE